MSQFLSNYADIVQLAIQRYEEEEDYVLSDNGNIVANNVLDSLQRISRFFKHFDLTSADDKLIIHT